MVWGKMILKSNGLSYMDFKLKVDVNKAINFTLNERYNGGYKFLNQDIYLIPLVPLWVRGQLEYLLRWILMLHYLMLTEFTKLFQSSNHPSCSGMKLYVRKQIIPFFIFIVKAWPQNPKIQKPKEA